MNNVMRWLPPVTTHEIYVIPSWVAHQGTFRLAEAGKLLGTGEAQRVARKEGTYELDEKLAHELRLKGLDIPAKGDVPALSPATWLRSSTLEVKPLAEWRMRFQFEHIEVEGLLIPGKMRDAFLGFLKTNHQTEPKDIWALVELADHFLFADSLQLLVRRG